MNIVVVGRDGRAGTNVVAALQPTGHRTVVRSTQCRDGPAVVTLAGPGPHELVDVARRTLAARDQCMRLVPAWQAPFSVQMAGDVLLPSRDACRTFPRFDIWLQTQVDACTAAR